jgi:hypothetical protein
LRTFKQYAIGKKQDQLADNYQQVLSIIENIQQIKKKEIQVRGLELTDTDEVFRSIKSYLGTFSEDNDK